MTQSTVTIQIIPTSRPSTPSWLGEVAVFAQVLAHLGLLKAIQEQVRFARARFGIYDTIDFLVVLIGYAAPRGTDAPSLLRAARAVCRKLYGSLWPQPFA